MERWLPRKLASLPAIASCKAAFCGNRLVFGLWIIVSAFVTIGLPGCVLFEFWIQNDEYGTYAFELLKFYPHMLLIPPMILWAVLFVFGAAMSLAWANFSVNKDRAKRRMRNVSIFAALIALVFLVGELRGSPLMLLELSPRGDNRVMWEQLHKQHRDILERPANVQGAELLALQEKQKKLRKELDYNAWRGKGKWSFSRIFYAGTFAISIFTVASLYMALTYAKDLPDGPVKNRFLTLLIATTVSYTVWFPARFYFISEIKGVVFGSAEASGTWDVILWATLVLFGLAVLVIYWAHIDAVKNVVGVVATLVIPLAGLLSASRLSGLIGLGSDPFRWIGLFIFIIVSFYVYANILAPPNEGPEKAPPKPKIRKIVNNKRP